jgi:predicted nuclease with TOPRIM domain
MPQTFFNYQQFALQMIQCENEQEAEELLVSLRDFIDNVNEYIHELEMEKCNLESEVASLQERVYDLEG